jgi:hypothetical protein
VLRNVFGSKRNAVTGEWRRLHNEELHGLDFSLNIKYEMVWTCSTYVGEEAYIQGFVGEI